MNTQLILIRHADSPYIEHAERTRGLSARGTQDAQQVMAVLQHEPVHGFVSSPYARAVDTIRPLAQQRGKDITLIEDLRERKIGQLEQRSFHAAKQAVYMDYTLKLPEGESSAEAQARAVDAMEQVLQQYEGQTVAAGTHGDIMTLMMNKWDSRYDYSFWLSTTMPDIYKLTFAAGRLTDVQRLWSAQHTT
ncbi:histidine phosphatase family protein [Paenibacillus sp. JX-17]|uniref:Histidine phosphatase family protein n=1 Tax=Paenibacillus lacisoli TaxID=3064525 RepID=A0ABT9CFU6_9BACL|nr:histidine phosphatase family protein [Paenibacillus sp. JX-17]MDO7907509.1 histidine phosphatase family protein [Paenibacillus sp. JX-17]